MTITAVDKCEVVAAFGLFARAWGEPTLLLREDGRIAAANDAALRALGPPCAAGEELAGFLLDPPETLRAYLRRCAGSGAALAGGLTLRGPDGAGVPYEARGSSVHSSGGAGFVLLRCHEQRAAGGSVAALNRKVEQLDGELRRHAETRRRLEEALRDKEVLIQELHHRVKNNLQALLSLFTLAETEEDDPGVRDKLRDARHRVEAMAVVQALLYRSDSFAALDAAAMLDELCRKILASYAADHVAFHLDAQPAPLAPDTAMPLGLIVAELLTNALKHAFPAGRRGRVDVTFRRDAGGGGYALSVADDGVGFHPERRNAGSAGVVLVQALAGQLDGEHALSSDDGTRWTIRFPDAGIPMPRPGDQVSR